MRVRPLLSYLSLSCLSFSTAAAQERRADQARQFLQQTPTVRGADQTQETVVDSVRDITHDDAFGVQQILKRQDHFQPIRLFGEVTGFHTTNAALTSRDAISDAFLVATFGAEVRRPLPYNLQFEASARVSTFRYDKLTALSFESIDVGGGLGYHASKLWDLDFSLRYNYTQLIGDDSGDTFFTNHTIAVAGQKTFVFSRAHYAFLGASALFGYADPKAAQRDEYAGYAGYHLQVSKPFSADLLYRFAYYNNLKYGRGDYNNTLSAAVRYDFTKWLSAFASYSYSFNRSNLSVFDYDVGNSGGGFGLSLSF